MEQSPPRTTGTSPASITPSTPSASIGDHSAIAWALRVPGLRIALEAVRWDVEPACPASVQALRQAVAEQPRRECLHTRRLQPQVRRRLDDGVVADVWHGGILLFENTLGDTLSAEPPGPALACPLARTAIRGGRGYMSSVTTPGTPESPLSNPLPRLRPVLRWQPLQPRGARGGRAGACCAPSVFPRSGGRAGRRCLLSGAQRSRAVTARYTKTVRRAAPRTSACSRAPSSRARSHWRRLRRWCAKLNG